MKKLKDVFPGYIMIVVTCIVSYWGAGIYMYSLGNYISVLTNAFGWTRAEISLAASFNGIASGLQGAFAGIAIDKYGPRVIIVIGISMLGIGFCLMYFMESLWMFYVFWLIAGLGYSMGMMPSLNAAMANWFVKRRGFMISLSMMGLCLSGITMTPLMMWLLVQYGWQTSFVIAGVVTLVIGLPLTWIFIKPRRPEYYGWLPDGIKVDGEKAADLDETIQAGVEYAASGDEVEFTVRQAIKDKRLWIFCIATSLGMTAFPVITAHSVPYLTDMGIDSVLAATITGTTIFMRFPTQLFFGWLADRLPKGQIKYLAMIGLGITAVGMFIFTRVNSIGSAWAYAVVIGLGNGAFLGVQFQLRGRYWGRKAFASIAGIIAPFMLISSMVTPVFAGWVYDNTGSYGFAFNIVLVLSVLAIIVMYFAAPPKPPDKVTGITEFL